MCQGQSEPTRIRAILSRPAAKRLFAARYCVESPEADPLIEALIVARLGVRQEHQSYGYVLLMGCQGYTSSPSANP